MNNLVMSITKNSSKDKEINIDKFLENHKIGNEVKQIIDSKYFNNDKKKKVRFSNKDEIKYVNNYIKNIDKLLISKNGSPPANTIFST